MLHVLHLHLAQVDEHALPAAEVDVLQEVPEEGGDGAEDAAVGGHHQLSLTDEIEVAVSAARQEFLHVSDDKVRASLLQEKILNERLDLIRVFTSTCISLCTSIILI